MEKKKKKNNFAEAEAGGGVIHTRVEPMTLALLAPRSK
jgi:hypothetical protein